MPVCEEIACCTEDICKTLELELGPALIEMLAAGIEELLADILAEAEDASQSSKRKTITAEDITQAVRRRKLPFTDILVSSQEPAVQ